MVTACEAPRSGAGRWTTARLLPSGSSAQRSPFEKGWYPRYPSPNGFLTCRTSESSTENRGRTSDAAYRTAVKPLSLPAATSSRPARGRSNRLPSARIARTSRDPISPGRRWKLLACWRTNRPRGPKTFRRTFPRSRTTRLSESHDRVRGLWNSPGPFPRAPMVWEYLPLEENTLTSPSAGRRRYMFPCRSTATSPTLV